jgi:hypothetical protein
MFKRLLPAFLVTILLAGLATAQAAGATTTNRSLGGSSSSIVLGYDHAPSTLRLDFGTVVRDTADEQSVGPGRWQAPPQVFRWHSFFTWNWFSVLILR